MDQIGTYQHSTVQPRSLPASVQYGLGAEHTVSDALDLLAHHACQGWPRDRSRSVILRALAELEAEQALDGGHPPEAATLGLARTISTTAMLSADLVRERQGAAGWLP